MTEPTNVQIADKLDRMADLIEAEDANLFRVNAYREGAQKVLGLDQPVANFIRQHQADELKVLPNSGNGIATVIGQYVPSGQSRFLQGLEVVHEIG